MQSWIRPISPGNSDPKKNFKVLPTPQIQWAQLLPLQSPTMPRGEQRRESPQPAGPQAQLQQHQAPRPPSHNPAAPNYSQRKRQLHQLLDIHNQNPTVTDPRLRKMLTMYRLSDHSLALERQTQTDMAAQRGATVLALSTLTGGDRAALPAAL